MGSVLATTQTLGAARSKSKVTRRRPAFVTQISYPPGKIAFPFPSFSRWFRFVLVAVSSAGVHSAGGCVCLIIDRVRACKCECAYLVKYLCN
jgi:hypothetical protein